MREVSIIVEQHDNGFVAYPVGLKGVVVAEGNSLEETVQDLKSAIEFHLDTFGREALEGTENVSVSVQKLPIAA